MNQGVKTTPMPTSEVHLYLIIGRSKVVTFVSLESRWSSLCGLVLYFWVS